MHVTVYRFIGSPVTILILIPKIYKQRFDITLMMMTMAPRDFSFCRKMGLPRDRRCFSM